MDARNVFVFMLLFWCSSFLFFLFFKIIIFININNKDSLSYLLPSSLAKELGTKKKKAPLPAGHEEIRIFAYSY